MTSSGPALSLSFDVGQFFADQSFLYLEDIDSPDMSLYSGRIHPGISPTHNTVVAEAENLLDFDVGLRRLFEEVLPKLSDCFLA
jgi:hypothetical protein